MTDVLNPRIYRPVPAVRFCLLLAATVFFLLGVFGLRLGIVDPQEIMATRRWVPIEIWFLTYGVLLGFGVFHAFVALSEKLVFEVSEDMFRVGMLFGPAREIPFEAILGRRTMTESGLTYPAIFWDDAGRENFVVVPRFCSADGILLRDTIPEMIHRIRLCTEAREAFSKPT